ncbi:hypothetical protein HF324_29360 [Chitinophaga oryzae]|uniref:Uncharacterized protein n=1 Tax=Chitinophaga oryzae TaxID=2725414 RepID=A0AAE6ZPF6_9BACT|nr:hypothetical protein [Chitinophaga oryzae]QJB35195.1 hypothetical protein HF329_29385 [Chitinophaga oryzae]QJB41730.1 hypothetical protein HF324_29360 [Chitinophaga oryzae]
MYKHFQKILALILLGVFTLNTVPREFIHIFTNHHDTQDTHASAGDAMFSGEHRHCDFLQIGVEPFDQYTTTFIAPVRPVIWVFQPRQLPETSYVTHRDLSPRAPPVEVA